MVKRKGIGYIIEAVVAVITLFVFVLGNTGSPQTQNWDSFQKDLAGNDLAYTLKNTGDIEAFLKRQETGSLRTVTDTLSSGRLKTSGTINNIPITDISVGFNAIESEQSTLELEDVTSTDQCAGDLEEIENQTGTPVKKTNSSISSTHNGNVLYFADTDPQISGGYNNQEDYDTMYVDNKTRCLFSSSEGPIYVDEFFKWNISDEEVFYDLKNISRDGDTATIYTATQAFKIHKTMQKSLNGIETSNRVDTFDLSEDNIGVYDLLVLRRKEELQNLNDIPSDARKVKDFLKEGSVLIMSNLSKNHLKDSSTTNFTQDLGLKWVDLDRGSTGDPTFTESTASRDTETYFEGLGGDINGLSLPPGGNVSSSNGETWMDENPLIQGTQKYKSTEWNATNYSMDPVKPSTVSNLPETACLTDENAKSSNLTRGEFTFTKGTDSSVTYNVVNVEVGNDLEHCKNHDTRALMVEGEGPYLNGETVMIEGREYVVRTKPMSGSLPEGEAAEFTFAENSNIELVNYRTSFEGFEGKKMARIAYKDAYNEEERKLIAAMLYWLADDSRQFGSQDTASGSTTVYGSIAETENTYMPYRLSLRWK